MTLTQVNNTIIALFVDIRFALVRKFFSSYIFPILNLILHHYMGQSIQEWTKSNL